MRRSPLGSILVHSILILAWSCGCFEAARAVSDPLSLGQALKDLHAHPRVVASPGLSARLTRRQSIYLDCHRLAFRNSQVADPSRNRPLSMLITPLAAQQLEVMERFFDVLLADLSFASESEAMAVAYVQFDRASARRELGQFSELRVLELEARYQNLLHRRTASEISRRLTRALLAQALGNPEELPRDLLPPNLPSRPETLPKLDALLARASEGAARETLGAEGGQADGGLVALERRQQLLELLLRLEVLAAAERSVQVESAWREMKLDESRSLYEQEVTADLGYSMSQQSRTQLLEQRVVYCQALTWAELNALLGQSVWTESLQEPQREDAQ